ncbi:MAG: nicotinate-nucleotide--dimethylbenzimidazole phosphoribosyltransferase [Beijerinckiaceae bacterium]
MTDTSEKQELNEIRRRLKAMEGPDPAAVELVRQREGQLTKPPGSLGRLETIVEWLAAWQNAAWQAAGPPKLDHALVCVFAGNHGVTRQGVSPYPAEVTQQMVANFAAGGAAINQICTTFGLDLKVLELALDRPTEDFTLAAAMNAQDCIEAFEFGMSAVPAGLDLLCLGEMGIGNTTSAAAIYTALFGGPAQQWAGRGTGLDDAGVARKAAVIETAIARHRDHLDDPLEILRRLGGREIAALAGAILAARLNRVPVVLDGYVVTAAAAVLHALDRTALDHCIAGHVSAEGAHRVVLQRLGKEPLLQLGMRLGEASGAAMAAGMIKAALACHRGMATFAEAGVAAKG